MSKEKLTFEQLPNAISEILLKIENIEAFINQTPNKQASTIDPELYIYGINGLAKLLNVSNVTAQRIKNSGKIPFSQAERTIIFKKEDVLKALSGYKPKQK